jgi:Receptor L domain
MLCQFLYISRIVSRLSFNYLVKNAILLCFVSVCGNIDIKNHVEYFYILENCTVIEGHLQIRLIEYSDEGDFNGLSFPHLREVTDYILLYRVYGMHSLANIFPNLSVIRGQHLFYNYALVIFEMPDLEELGLRSLTRVVRGAVRIEKNPKLCYIDTIFWAALGTNMEDNFILQNKDVNECYNMCPKNNAGGDICYMRPIKVDADENYQQASCWNGDSCQIGLPTIHFFVLHNIEVVGTITAVKD